MIVRRFTLVLVALLLLLLLRVDRGALAQPEPPQGLRVDDLSVFTPAGSPPEQVTVSFRIVNDGADIKEPFRTAVVASAGPQDASSTYYVTTPELGAGSTVYVSQIITRQAAPSNSTFASRSTSMP